MKAVSAVNPVPAALVQRSCACGGKCDECTNKLQRRAAGPGPAFVPPIVHQVLRSPGQPLDTPVREQMEDRFGHNFGNVRVHTGAMAGESAQHVNALAYTVGPNIVFGAGQYTPSNDAGQRLLAHELAHVAQQRGASADGPLAVAPSDAPAEMEADRAAAAALGAGPNPAVQPTAAALHKQDAPSTLGPNLKYTLDPTLAAKILASCAAGEGNPKTCAEIRSLLNAQPPQQPATPNLDPNSPQIQAILDDIHKRIYVPPIYYATPSTPGANPPAAPGPAPASTGGSPFDSLGKTVDKLTKFELKTKAGTVSINLTSGAKAALKGKLAEARFIRINFEAMLAGNFSASIAVDGVPLELKAKVDIANKNASVSLRLFGSTGTCQTSVSSDVITKINDAGKKLSDLAAQATGEAAYTPDQSGPPKPAAPATPQPAGPPKTGFEKDLQAVGDFASAAAAKIKLETDIASAVAAFVDAMNSVDPNKKEPCKKGKVEFSFGATFPLKIGDDTPGINPPPPTLGPSLRGEF